MMHYIWGNGNASTGEIYRLSPKIINWISCIHGWWSTTLLWKPKELLWKRGFMYPQRKMKWYERHIVTLVFMHSSAQRMLNRTLPSSDQIVPFLKCIWDSCMILVVWVRALQFRLVHASKGITHFSVLIYYLLEDSIGIIKVIRRKGEAGVFF